MSKSKKSAGGRVSSGSDAQTGSLVALSATPMDSALAPDASTEAALFYLAASMARGAAARAAQFGDDRHDLGFASVDALWLAREAARVIEVRAFGRDSDELTAQARRARAMLKGACALLGELEEDEEAAGAVALVLGQAAEALNGCGDRCFKRSANVSAGVAA